MRVLAAALALAAALTTPGFGLPSLRTARAAAVACPRGLLAPGRNAIGPATAAVLRVVPRKEDPQVVSAALAPNDLTRGRQARVECGRVVWRRTIVVYFTRRAYLPAQSASQGVAFVGRFRSGYRVWELVH